MTATGILRFAAGAIAAARCKATGLQYTPMWFPLDLIDIPVFPREIWGRLVKETRAAVA
jgi:hypothetical protein